MLMRLPTNKDRLHRTPIAEDLSALRPVTLCLLLVTIVCASTTCLVRPRVARADETASEHWAFRRLPQSTTLPSSTPDSGDQPIDRFIAEGWREAGIEPVGLAHRRTVARRLYFDLTGLPPTPRELETFLADESPEALDRLTDALLRRPEFGERWGRHWLDVARYADSNGCSIESNNTYDNAWRYRDYVITALNEDTPFDQFVVEQIAGDLLDSVSDQQRSRQLIATGFLLLGPKAFGINDYEMLRLDVIDEQLDTIGKAMLGLSLGCARCHDHKLDPIRAADYYALAGIFSSTNSVRREKGWRQGMTWHRVALPGLDAATTNVLESEYRERLADAESGKLKEKAEATVKEVRLQLEELEKKKDAPPQEIDAARAKLVRAERAVRNTNNAKEVLLIISPVPVAMAVSDRDKPVDEHIRLRGDPNEKGDQTPRRVLPLFANGDVERFAIPTESSGRLELARWLVDVDHGAGHLLARVIVNRIWGHLMGRPLVVSSDNFGMSGDTPSHPTLLDHLARTLVKDGWSVKRMIRRIAQTRTYRLATAENPTAQRIDPDNRLLWRHHTRRLDAESLRDSLLMMSGALDRQRGGKTLQHLGLITIGKDHIELDTPSPYNRRSIYLPILRDAIGFNPPSDEALGLLTTFDFADPNLVCGDRTTTTVPTQALFLMNSSFLMQQSRRIAEGLLVVDRFPGDRERIEDLFVRAFGRPATEEEMHESLRYLETFPAQAPDAEGNTPEKTRLDAWSSLCQALLSTNEFLFLN
jgi:hypothetical protein